MPAQETISDASLDLALAAQLQSALLPASCPTNCPNEVAAARNRMCGNVGGDFYDFIRINDDQMAVIVGDVVGHGVRASLVMAQIMGYLRSRPKNIARPIAIIADLNRMLIDLGKRTDSILPCSMFYTVIDAPTGISFFVNAGHPRPFICDPTICFTLTTGPGNLLLGVEEFTPIEGCHTFTPGQRLVLYTDGVTDAQNDNGEHFGKKRIRQVTNAHISTDPQSCADALFAAIDEFRGQAVQSDDETVVVIDRI